MKIIQRITALILCIIMITPVQGLTVLAETGVRIEEIHPLEELAKETERIEETMSLETLKEENERIEETLPLQAIDEKGDEWDGEFIIYWNPGGTLPIATESDAETKGISKKKLGNDNEDGLTPSRAVSTLSAALERAQQMQEQMGVELSEITICAMSPMEIADGQLYVLNGQHVNITSWEGRAYDDDTIFYLNGGQLTLRNVSLDSGKISKDTDCQLIRMDGGALQLGQNVEISGQVAMDYRLENKGLGWELATPSDSATKSNATKIKKENTGFDITDYILYEGDDYLEYMQDESNASTWKNPIIELLEGFEGSDAGYQIKLYSDHGTNQLELVKSMYADELTTEEFEELFTLAEVNCEEWKLITYSERKANVRDTGTMDLMRYHGMDLLDSSEDVDLTIKTLRASRAASTTIYWNPGGQIVDGSETYPAGVDGSYDGTEPYFPVKSLGNAMERAGLGGTVVCMQQLRLEGDVSGFLNFSGYDFIEGTDEYRIKTPGDVPTVLQPWNVSQPIFVVPDGVRLNLETITLIGLPDNSNMVIHNEAGGTLGIDKNVTAKTGYIQIDATERMRTEQPVQVTSTDGGGIVSLFFSGINEDLSYRYIDVVAPEGELAEGLDGDFDLAVAVGRTLQEKFELSLANRDDLNGGMSRFDWELRPDTEEDTDGKNPQNLELYTDYYYDAIYLDGVNGDDSLLGASCHYPVATWKRAMEIWKQEVGRSVTKQETAKQEADEAGFELTEAELNKRYPIPELIYICNTVTIDHGVTETIWQPEYDFKGNTYQAEVVSHTDIPNEIGGEGTKRHELPQVLFYITGGKEITFTNMHIRNITDQKNTLVKKSVTVLVDDGALNLDGTTTLTGERMKTEVNAAKAVTSGIHIYLDGSTQNATLHMKESWNGSIQRRQHGVIAEGGYAVVNMKSGSIRENNSYDSESSASTVHERGAGVVLKGGASMDMTGGSISENTVYQYGAGIYIEGSGTGLTMTGGSISRNKMARKSSNAGNDASTNTTLKGYGIGIYAGAETTVHLGREDGSIEDVNIIENYGYLADGVGIYSQGELRMKHTTVSDNISAQALYGANSSNYISAGIGIHVSGGGTLDMDSCLVSGNKTENLPGNGSYYEQAYGAGIYINGNNSASHRVQNSEISGNLIGNSYNNDGGQGGGVYVGAGELKIDGDSRIEGNKARTGGGIYMNGLSNTNTSSLIIKDSTISDNLGHSATGNASVDESALNGWGGGIYAGYHSSIVLLEGNIFTSNRARFGGGIYSAGYGASDANQIIMTGGDEKEEWIQFVNNVASAEGGGLYTGNTVMTGTKVSINNNVSKSQGGGWYSSSGTYVLSEMEIDNNTASKEGGGWYSNAGTYTLSDTTINGNTSSLSGGGWYSRNNIASSYTISRVKINENTASKEGGGWHSYNYKSSTYYISNTEMNGNKALGGSGGGWQETGYSTSTHYIFNLTINDNYALGNGGGWYSGGTQYISGLTINGNTSMANGGGWFSNLGTQYISGLTINDNTASRNGGGWYSTGTTYLSEHPEITFSINGNQAKEGGGIYQNRGTVIIDAPGSHQNSAEEQGSNLYLTNSGVITLLKGHFKQPEELLDGVYNMYVDRAGGGQQILDLNQVQVEKKTEGSPDAVYLKTGNSYLTYLQAPPDADMTFPIDLSSETFNVGSVVIKPADRISVESKRPNSNTGLPTGSNTYTCVTYDLSGQLKDATINLGYSKGGKLPKRMHLGSFKDSKDSNLTNVVLVGEGIYLSSDGDDTKDGLSPETAVATFKVAKERLKANIIETASNPEVTIGYSPFIYICGTVEITDNETWELDWKDKLYLETNQGYLDEEGDNAQSAQVRRFASFVDQPMIKVGTDSDDAAHLKADKILINGMLDAVITADQAEKSPILQIMDSAEAILYGNAQLYNNHARGIAVNGSLVLEGEEHDLNQQVMDHNGYYVQMLGANAEVTMNGYSRILSSGSNEHVITNIIYAIHSAGGKIQMKDYSQLDGKYGTLGANGIMNSGILVSNTGGNIQVEMDDYSSINNMSVNGIYNNSPNSNSSICMKGFSSINNAYKNGIMLTAFKGSDEVCMEDSASINDSLDYGIYLSPSSAGNGEVRMKGKASINNINNYGVYINNNNIKDPSNIYMDDFASISDCTYGVYMLGSGITALYMNTNDNAKEDDCAKITNSSKTSFGVRLETGNNKLVMAKNACIENVGNGLYSDGDMKTGTIEILMKDDSRIANCNTGYYVSKNVAIPTLIHLKGRAAIEGCSQYALNSDTGSASYDKGWKKLEVRLEEYARISGNGAGFNFPTAHLGAGGYIKINMSGDSIIGGQKPYDSGDSKSGNRLGAISANVPLQLNMEGRSKISGNGNVDYVNSNNAVIYLRRENYGMAGTSTIHLSGNAAICGNRGGIFIPETRQNAYENKCEIILDGTGSNSRPAIEDNTDGIWLGSDAILKLMGSSVVGATTYHEKGKNPRSIIGYGSLELDGESVIEGPIQLLNAENPIIMTNKALDPLRRYQLEIAEGFIGRPVVSPGGSETDISDQLRHFEKLVGYDLAADKLLRSDAPHIVLMGENNVYLSGVGNDGNSGNSPSDPVRTFKRAKELLEGGAKGGYYETGANIIICGSTVAITDSADADWSFDAGGIVTNARSSHSWKPLVIRHNDFTGTLISVSKEAGMVSFEHITIDGGSQEGIYMTTNVGSHLLKIDNGGYTVLGDGAVLQNNKSTYTLNDTYANILGVYVDGGTLEMDGGIIQGLERHNTSIAALPKQESAGLAVSCNNGTFIFKAGIIRNNFWSTSLTGSYDIGLVNLCKGSTMAMSGGIITENEILKRYETRRTSSMVLVKDSLLNMSGGTIRDNIGGIGSAIGYNATNPAYTHGCIISGGQISNQQAAINSTANVSVSQEPVKEYSPIYSGGGNFQIKGGGANIKDSIYLSAPENNIKISGNIYQNDKKYIIYLYDETNRALFKKGSVVIQPDGNFIRDATPYMKNFEVRSTVYILDYGQTNEVIAGSDSIRESQCLLLMKPVYLNGRNGDNSRSGTRPSQAVKTFEQAKVRGQEGYGNQDYYVIYLSGPAINQSADAVWSLPNTAYMCRYTGFELYESNGSMVSEEAPERRAYTESLLMPERNLTLDGIKIYGRRKMDSISKNGQSIVTVNPGVTVTMKESDTSKPTILERNYNQGVHMTWPPEHPEGIPQNLDQKGGAVQIKPEGVFNMQGGVIRDTDAVWGDSVYVGADENIETKNGHLLLSHNPELFGSIYLAGTGTETATYIEADSSFKPDKEIMVDIENDYNKRPVIQYPSGYVPGAEELKIYQFSDSIQAIYSIINRTGAEEIFELDVRQVLYLDGQNENALADGLTPESAFKTLEQVYESLAQKSAPGVVVYVVNTVDILSGESIIIRNTMVQDVNGKRTYQGAYQDQTGKKIDISGQVYFKRYAQPTDYGTEGFPAGFNKPTLKDTLFWIHDGGSLELSGTYLDGHSNAVVGSDITLVSEKVWAEGPLVTVEGEQAYLLCDNKKQSAIPNSQITATLFTNNYNILDKKFDPDKYLDTMGAGENQVAIYEGSSAAIELLNGATASLIGTEFTNLGLGEGVSGGTDVYSNGTLRFMQRTKFTGSVFLEGMETYNPDPAATYSTSRFLTVDEYGNPMATDFQVLLRDPYNGRKVVEYSPGEEDPNIASNIPRYRLEEVVKAYFYLNQRPSDLNVLELQIPGAVYIDGINGIDDDNNVAAGSTPDNPVKTLKRAYELLKRRGGYTIYVVNTIEIVDEVTLKENSYEGKDGNIWLDSTDRIRIKRYVQPDFALNSPFPVSGYKEPDFKGSMLRVKEGAELTLGNNVVIDGHSKEVTGDEYPKELIVDRVDLDTHEPMIFVEEGGVLNLNNGVTFQDSNNIFEKDTENPVNGLHGGAIHNSGITIINHAIVKNVNAEKGGGIYQDGDFRIFGGIESLKGFEVYLTTDIQGTDHYIQIGELIPNDQIAEDAFAVDMDHAVPGRKVVQFLNDSVYEPDADAEHEHFELGNSVPSKYFLVERKDDPMILELQDWNVLDVVVPSDIYLIVQRKGNFNNTTRLSAIRSDANGSQLLSAPEYTIINEGRYEVAVSVRAFENQNTDAGISHETMTLVSTANEALGEKDLYLAIKGLGDLDGDTAKGFTMAETALKPYEGDTAAEPAQLGVLEPGTAGRFTFIGAVGDGFVDKYLDRSFPIEGVSREDAQMYMDGSSTTSVVNARAKYALRYKLDIIPSRR